ncbi:MAG TPA: beta-xylosidase [Acidobacteriaceae bacterium]|nr:beta-xylosidase [Acidobacteriaceae bacterium]
MGPFSPIYSWFGYDESNYSTTHNGQALLHELHDLSPVPVYIRAHFLLASGDGKPELKWSSSNVYTEDAQGKPVYSWTILDQIFDAYAAAHVRPMVELGFMPKALSSHPDPYHIGWPLKPGQEEGWSFPPKDYERWEELAHQVAAHMVKRYGAETVSTWYWEIWNEPDGRYYWKGTQEDYNKLYDYAVAGVRKALPNARVGGPATTGPGPRGSASEYLRAFLAHCAKERSKATGGAIPLDFISFHVKGRPNVVAGHVQMGLDRELNNASAGFAIVREFPRFQKLPIILSEADPEGCAACSARLYPPNAYRNGPLYPSYTAAAMKGLIELADRDHINLSGILTWAFEFEGKPYFDGYRTLATNGVDKPELNFFRMAGLMRGERVAASSSGAVPLDSILHDSVRQAPDVDALAAGAPGQASVLLWNYQDNDVPAPGSKIEVSIKGISPSAHRVLLQQYRIDGEHSNAYTVWKEMGSPQNPTPAQYAKLQAAGQLQLLDSPRWMTPENGSVKVEMNLPRQGLSLLRITWPTNASGAR